MHVSTAVSDNNVTNQISQPPTKESMLCLRQLKDRGWTDTLIDNLLGQPDKLQRNPHDRRWAKMKLYVLDRVQDAENTDEFLEVVQARAERQKRLANRPTAVDRREAKFFKIYGEDWNAALPKACEYMFSLNRYAKHETCKKSHKEAIYDLKNDLVALLYKRGYCTNCFSHNYDVPCFCYSPKGCYRCRKGVYKRLEFICFEFDVNGTKYSWHQPKELVMFNCQFAKPPEGSNWTPSDEEKAIELSAAKFAEAKHLVSWVVQMAHSGTQRTSSDVQGGLLSGKYWKKATLLKRQWTEEAISRFLGEPDEVELVQHQHSTFLEIEKKPVYLSSRVNAIEAAQYNNGLWFACKNMKKNDNQLKPLHQATTAEGPQ